MITFIISHNEHSYPSCDVIRSNHCVPASDVKLHTIRSLPTGAQDGNPLPPHHPPPLPISGGLRAECQNLSSSLFLFSIRFCTPPHCELTSPHIAHFSLSQYSIRAHAQLHYKFTHKPMLEIFAHTYTSSESSSHINNNCMQAASLAAE